MIAVDQPRPAHAKLSLFRHLKHKHNNESITIEQNHKSYNNAVKSLTPSPGSTPPASPLLAYAVQLPRLTKDKAQRRDFPITLVHRFDTPLVVRDRLSRDSSSSSSSSGTSPSSSSSTSPSTSPSRSSRRSRTTRAVSTYLPTTPFLSTPRIVPWTLYLPPAHVHALYMGYMPHDMDDNWFIYSEGPDLMGKLKVHFHRSWTGVKIAELFVVMDVKGEGAGKVVGVKWDERSQGGRMGSDEAKYLVRTTLQRVVGVDLEPEST